MKNLKKKIAFALLFSIGLGITPVQTQKTDRAEAGIATIGLLFLIPNYAYWVEDSCRGRRYLRSLANDWACFWGWVFGDQDEISKESMKWMSADHPAVKEGIKTRSGEVVKFTEAERRAHNDQLDLYVEIVQKLGKELENTSLTVEGSTEKVSAEKLTQLAVSKIEEISNKISKELAKDLETETEVRALEKFLKLRFGFSVKPTKS